VAVVFQTAVRRREKSERKGAKSKAKTQPAAPNIHILCA